MKRLQDDSSPEFAWVVLLMITVGACLHFMGRQYQRRATHGSMNTMVSCPNPNCIRCQRYRQVQSSAKTRLPWVTRQMKQDFPYELISRITDSIQQPQRYILTNGGSVQAPTVLMVRDLPTQEIVTGLHANVLDSFLKEGADDLISTVLDEITKASVELWNRNDTPSGSWEVLPLLNQGVWNHEIISACPQLAQFVCGMSNLLDECLFGNAIVSKIYPGTDIEPHCGPTNVRHRLQLTLHVPNTLRVRTPTKSPDHLAKETTVSNSSHPLLRVGHDQCVGWNKPGEHFVFDDSFVHSVLYEHGPNTSMKSSDSECRMVLIADLWHPALTSAERTLIKYMYPPFSSGKKLD